MTDINIKRLSRISLHSIRSFDFTCRDTMASDGLCHDSRVSCPSESFVSSLSDAYLKKVRPCIDLIDTLRSYGLDQDVALPSVVVIGDQSSGKSSTLEAISGILLPRGNGIVTRCPLELQLKSRPPGTKWLGKISYKKNNGDKISKEIQDPERVEEEVTKAQDEIAGRRKGISNTLITLVIEAPNVPDVTLIDLPGLVRVKIENQTEDIPAQIKDLILEYIRKDETIILCVIPCNIDIATTEALQLAQDADPTGERTLGVLTKPDLVDRGSEHEIISIVNNARVKLKKGYTMIRCRGQQAIIDGQSLQEAMATEGRFFENHEVFREVKKSLVGIRTLAVNLTTELVNQIKKSVPMLRKEVREKLKDTRCEIVSLKTGIPEDDMGKRQYLFELLSKFSSDVDSVVSGSYRHGITKDMRFITMAIRKFEELSKEVKDLLPEEEDITFISKIKEDMEETRGKELPTFLQYSLCERMVKTCLEQYKQPCFQCLYAIDAMAEKVFMLLASKTFQNFIEIDSDIKAIIGELRKESFKVCESNLYMIFATEAMVYTQTDNFFRELDTIEKERDKVFDKMQTRRSRGGMTREEKKPGLEEEETMFDRILAYLKVATQRLCDTVPMMIMYQMIHKLSEDIKIQVTILGSQPSFLEKLKEDQDTAVKRRMLKDRLQRLTNAEKDISLF